MSIVGNRARTLQSVSQQTILTAAQPLCSTENGCNEEQEIDDDKGDKPIGYGAFGVVWAVRDPRFNKLVALKKMPDVFQNLVSSKRAYREIKMLSGLDHDNVLKAIDFLPPLSMESFKEIYVITELMQSDLHKIIVSPQILTRDHIKVFLYQILRGLTYLHSAHIIHRDIKPGNLLVNSNCVLKICDFGLARIATSRDMTQEVVTQYYRAPELLMGAKYYTSAIDMWSVGCIFAELLGRRILFQAATPIQQLDLITELLGTPRTADMHYACQGAKAHMLKKPHKLPSLSKLYNLSSNATSDAVHLLSQLLLYNPDYRIGCSEALNHSYLDQGRLRYHSCMCSCCKPVDGGREFIEDFEPIASHPFDDGFERNYTSVQQLKEKIFMFMTNHCQDSERTPLRINHHSRLFKNFTNSSVAQRSELPPSPHQWED